MDTNSAPNKTAAQRRLCSRPDGRFLEWDLALEGGETEALRSQVFGGGWREGHWKGESSGRSCRPGGADGATGQRERRHHPDARMWFLAR